MTVQQDERDVQGGDAPEATARPRSAALRFVVLAVVALLVFVAATWLGQAIRNHRYATMRPVVIAQCQAVAVDQLVSKRGGHFSRIDIGPTTTVRRSDGGWAVIETATLAGHVENGVADGDQVAAKKVCDFSQAAAGHKGVRPGVVTVNYDGPRGVSAERFELDRSGTAYTGAGSGLRMDQ